ncbi:MAG: hypothetical protein L0H59_08875 [Tomitella sp.]|nr:hypothetical protein [Tomitella sp.]
MSSSSLGSDAATGAAIAVDVASIHHAREQLAAAAYVLQHLHMDTPEDQQLTTSAATWFAQAAERFTTTGDLYD